MQHEIQILKKEQFKNNTNSYQLKLLKSEEFQSFIICVKITHKPYRFEILNLYFNYRYLIKSFVCFDAKQNQLIYLVFHIHAVIQNNIFLIDQSD